jgi:hypothetical protein
MNTRIACGDTVDVDTDLPGGRLKNAPDDESVRTDDVVILIALSTARTA